MTGDRRDVIEEIEEAIDRLERLDWDQFRRDGEYLQSLIESGPCWMCGKPIGKVDPIFLDGTWDCHPVCAPEAKRRFGFSLEMKMRED